MEADETVPLTFEQDGPGEDAGAMSGLPAGFTPQTREAAPESVIDITGMLKGLEASRRTGGR